jgi:hypothetical protein
MLPKRPETEKIARRTPASVMPTLNRCVTYRVKKGKSSVRPTPSTNEVPTSTQNLEGYSR